MPVIAFSGKLGSGKTTVSSAVAVTLGWARVGFGDYVRSVVRKRGLGETREVLQQVGTELLEVDPRAFCRAVLSSAGKIYPTNLIIDGLRHIRTISIIRDLISPVSLKIVSISIPEEIRRYRLEQRDGDDAASINTIEAHSSEQEVDIIRSEFADLVVDGKKSVEILVNEVAAWIKVQS